MAAETDLWRTGRTIGKIIRGNYSRHMVRPLTDSALFCTLKDFILSNYVTTLYLHMISEQTPPHKTKIILSEVLQFTTLLCRGLNRIQYTNVQNFSSGLIRYSLCLQINYKPNVFSCLHLISCSIFNSIRAKYISSTLLLKPL